MPTSTEELITLISNTEGLLTLISHWAVQVFLVTFAALVLDYVQRLLLTRLLHRLQTGTRSLWDDAVVDSARRPITLLIWVLGLSFAAAIAGEQTGATVFQLVPAARGLGLVVAVTWFLMLLVRNGEKAFLETEREGEPPIDLATVHAIARLMRISMLITSLLVVVQNLGFSISGVLAFGGIGGLAVGLAAKDLLANFFGTLTIFLDRPFAEGDWIRSPDKEIEGVVELISWRATRIRTFDKRALHVPNATFTTISVENPSRMTHRRIYETVGIRYEDAPKMAGIVREVEQMLRTHPEMDASQTLMVNFNSFAPSSLDFFVYAFTKTTDWVRFHEIKQDVLLKINGIVAEQGAEIAFPTSTLHVSGPVRVAGNGPSESRE